MAAPVVPSLKKEKSKRFSWRFFLLRFAFFANPALRGSQNNKGAFMRRMVLAGVFFLVVSVGSLSFPQEAHAWVWAVFWGAAAIGGMLQISGQLDDVGRSILNAIGGIIISGLAWLVYGFLKIATYFLYLAGMVFNWSVVELVFRYAINFGNSPAVLAGWNILKDFANIALLFGFIFIGIATILNLQNYNAKKTLVRLLLFALLLNFSLLIAEAVIDTSNAFSYVLYNQAVTPVCPEGSAVTNPHECGLAANIANIAGVTTWTNYNPGNTSTIDPLHALGAFFALLVFTIVLTVVILAAAIMFVIRAIVLTFLIITSPIGFVGMVVPFMGGLAKEWWSRLVNQSFFAPVYLLLLLVCLKLMEGLSQGGSGGATLAEALFSKDGSLVGVVVMLFMLIGFMVASIIAAKKFGALGADFAVGVAGKATGFATFGLPAAAARFGIGRTAGFAARKIATSRTLARAPILRGALYAGAKKAATSSFDARSTRFVKEPLGLLPKEAGIALGTRSDTARGGARAYQKERIQKTQEAHQEIADLIAKRGPDGNQKRELNTLYRRITSRGAEIQRMRQTVIADLKAAGFTGEALTAELNRRIAGDLRYVPLGVTQIEQEKDVQEVHRIREEVSVRNTQTKREDAEGLARASRGLVAGGLGLTGAIEVKGLSELADLLREGTTLTAGEKFWNDFRHNLSRTDLHTEVTKAPTPPPAAAAAPGP